MKIPGPLRRVFDSYPLFTFSQTSTEKDHVRTNEYFFGSADGHLQFDQQTRFCLAVHNILPIQINGETKYIPTDPVSLSNALILCHRLRLKLPTDLRGSQWAHSMITLSHLASAENQLPFLVDFTGSRIDKITSTVDLSQTIASKFFSASTLNHFLFHFLDELNDLWILILLSDITLRNQLIMSPVFQRDADQTNLSLTQELEALSLISRVTSWGSFSTRYAHLLCPGVSFHRSVSKLNLPDFVAAVDPVAVHKAFHTKLRLFERSAPLIMEHLESKSERSDLEVIVEIKLASLIVIISEFVSNDSISSNLINTELCDVKKFSFGILSNF